MKKVILVSKNLSNGFHIPHSLLIGSLFFLSLLFVGVTYAAYYYGEQRAKHTSIPLKEGNITPAPSLTENCEWLALPFFNPEFSWVGEKNNEWLSLCTQKMVAGTAQLQKNHEMLVTHFSYLQGQITDSVQNHSLEQTMAALTTQLARLQMELVHLDELGKQLVEMVELDAKEFNFNLTWEGIVTERQIIAVEDAKFIEVERLAKEKNQPTDVQLAKIAEIERAIEDIANYIEDRREKFEVLESLLLKRRTGAKILPSGWPLKQGYISSPYGWRENRFHKGIDIVAPMYSGVLAVEKGSVTIAREMEGYGNLVELKHSDTYTTRYAHNSENLVKVGDSVEKGQIIALLGATGHTTGAHVHFEVRRTNEPLNPLQYLSNTEQFLLTETINVSKN